VTDVRPGPAFSLRRRLLALVLAAIAAASLMQALAAYAGALREADALFDEHLREIAAALQPQAPPADLGVEVQIWGPDGVELFRSGAAPPVPVVQLGLSDVEVAGTHWRVYALQLPGHVVRVAQDRDARQQRARAIAWRAAVPVALLAPLLMGAAWLLVSGALAPVERMRRQVAARADDDLSPLPEGGLPEEVHPLVHELNLLFARIAAAFEAQKHFVADAAHELRSPLAALKLQAQGLRRAADAPAREAALARLEGGIDRAIRLVGQLLALARADADAEPPQAVDLEALAREVVAELLPRAVAQGLDLGLEATQAPALQGRPEALRILLRNLVENAVKYTPQGGRIDLSLLRAADGSTCLVVEDAGPGIPPAQRARVLQRFHRADGAAAVADGCGLGLAIVQAVAARHGARLVLDDSPRLGGLRATVRFPAPAPGAATQPAA
jgi:two-component system OmpR family sensor kinase